MNKTVTLGIAAYNVEEYISLCIESAMRQVGDDIEIIIVDDGSTDASSALCDEYALRDNRIKVVHKENGGLSSVRNYIIENAQGEWICFIDGDDLLADNAVEIIRKNLSDKFQIIFFDAVYFRNEKSIPRYNIELQNIELNTKEDLQCYSMDCIYLNKVKSTYMKDYVGKTLSCSWGKVYNRKFLLDNNLLFDLRARKSQDTIFSFCCSKYLSDVLFVREAIYCYRQNGNSMVNKYNTKIKQYNNIIMNAFAQYIAERDDEVKPLFMQRYYCLGILNIKVASELDFCNKNNKKPYEQREKEFYEYISQDHYADAVKSCDPSNLTASDRLVYNCVVNNDFKGICKYVRKKEIDSELRYFASVFGLNKLKATPHNSRLKP